MINAHPHILTLEQWYLTPTGAVKCAWLFLCPHGRSEKVSPQINQHNLVPSKSIRAALIPIRTSGGTGDKWMSMVPPLQPGVFVSLKACAWDKVSVSLLSHEYNYSLLLRSQPLAFHSSFRRCFEKTWVMHFKSEFLSTQRVKIKCHPMLRRHIAKIFFFFLVATWVHCYDAISG